MVAESVQILDYETDEIVGEVSRDGVLRANDEVFEQLMQDLTRGDGAIPRLDGGSNRGPDDDAQVDKVEHVEPGNEEYFWALSGALPSPYKIDADPGDVIPGWDEDGE